MHLPYPTDQPQEFIVKLLIQNTDYLLIGLVHRVNALCRGLGYDTMFINKAPVGLCTATICNEDLHFLFFLSPKFPKVSQVFP